MLVQHRTAQRCAAALTGAVVALLLPPLTGASASPASTARVTIEPLGHSGQGAAGACLLYRLVARDAAYEETVTQPGQAFASVTLTEKADVETQDVDFCTTGGKGDVFKRAPRYFNAGDGSSGTPLYYNPGWTLTPEEAGNPDKARQDVPPATSSAPVGRPDKAAKTPSQSSAGANNYLNLDQAIVGYDPEAGGFVFGVVAGQAGSAELSGYLDHNGDGIKGPEITGVSPADMDAEKAVPVAFTQGGAPYSLAVADAVRSVVASPKSVTAVAGSTSGASLLAAVTNAEGQPLVGVRPRLVAEGGPNATEAPTWTGSCAASDNSGRSACTYSGQLPGTDQVAVFVNQTSGGSVGRDPSEPFDVVEVTLDRAAAAPPSPSASPSAATTSPSPSASTTPEQTTATPEPRACATSLLLDRSVLTATQSAEVVVRGAPGAAVRLLAYSRPSTTYRVVRESTTGPDGTASFTVRPLTSTRLYAVEEDCPATASEVLQVRSALSLAAARSGVREVVFRGRAVPGRAAQLVSLYRIAAGRQVLTAQVRTAGDGTWALRRAFTGTGRFGFVARTGADMVNAAGTSPIRVVDVR